MTTYNGVKYLPQQISSMLKQSYKEWQLFIRDNNPNDNILNIIEEHIDRYPNRVKLLAGEKRNVCT